jgi:hypothetical protein
MAIEFLVESSKCFRKLYRGSVTVESVGADETKVITIKFEDALNTDAVCVVSATGWPVLANVQEIGNAAGASDHIGYVIVSITNQSQIGISSVDINYLIL